MKGLISKLNAIDAQRQLNVSEQSLLDSQTSSLLDLISPYKTLGGGWEIK